MKKKCPFGKCEKCVWFRPWDYQERDAHGGLTGKVSRVDKCSLEVILETIPKIHGAIDGLQGGVNEARNRSIETKNRVESLGAAVSEVIAKVVNFANIKMVSKI